MLPPLYKSKKVQRDFQLIQTKINLISNMEIRNKCNILLKELKKEVANLEDNHRLQLYDVFNSTMLNSTREKIFSLRKELKILLKENI